MNAVPQPRPGRMTADEFLAWAVHQEFRGELVGGEVVAMAAERASHARIKARAHRALDDTVRAAALACEAFPDGMVVQVLEDTLFEPDATLRCGEPLPDDALKMHDPVVVVEVAPSSTCGNDSGTRLAAYFRLPSVRHYLILDGRARLAIHHARAGADGPIATRILREGESLRLDPPGIALDVAALFGPPPPPA